MPDIQVTITFDHHVQGGAVYGDRMTFEALPEDTEAWRVFDRLEKASGGKIVCRAVTQLDGVQVKGPLRSKLDLTLGQMKARALVAQAQSAPVCWWQVDEGDYFAMLKHAGLTKTGGFLHSIPEQTHASSGLPMFQPYRKEGDSYYAGSRPMTVPEFVDSLQAPLSSAGCAPRSCSCPVV